jgi:hypothetical protein
VRSAQNALLQTFPLGWSATPGDVRAYPWVRSAGTGGLVDVALARWLFKLLGLMMTGAAVSFGAPFWFDLLSRVSSLRAAGPKPAKPDELPHY